MGTAWQGSHSHGFPKATRRRILQRDPHCQCPGCRRCTPTGCTNPSTEADHIVPASQGGTNDDTNGQGLCTPCHAQRTQAQAAQGRARHTTQRPRETHPGLL